MDCLYKTSTKYTLEEYRKYNLALMKKTFLIILLFVLFILAEAVLLNSVVLLLIAILYVIVFIWAYNRNIKKVFESNKVAQNAEVSFEFYDTYFTQTSENGYGKIEYTNLDKVIETKTNFYLMIAKNQGYILKKENFPEGLAEFLRGII